MPFEVHDLAEAEASTKEYLWTLNFGPQHPATHTTLRLILTLSGETVVKAVPDIGFLHSGFEKLGEHLNFNQYVTIVDRMNYISPLANEIAWHHAVEKLLGIELTPRCKYLRTILAELMRLHDHLLNVGTTGLDLGAFTSFLYAFQQRELIYDIVESASGQRFHTSYTRVGGLLYDVNSQWVDKVRSFVKSAAGAQASILIRGEVGTGKNALASAIHNAAGSRRDGPFIVFSCASIPNELVIGELLGYDEEGSNRHSGRPSKFELAEGGTLFFQDVDVLPLEAQAVLLNALELRMIQRLGGHRAVDVNARIIASTSANMETLISQGAFRPDLYYRLSIFTITLPPLRERPRDIPVVVDRILIRLNKQLGYKVFLATEVMDVFKKYPWPGNIREMEAVLGRAATQVAGAGEIGMLHIPGNVRRMETETIPPSAQSLLQVGSLDEMERETILLTLQTQRGNVSRVAQVLGVSRTTLWRKLKSYGIKPDEYR